MSHDIFKMKWSYKEIISIDYFLEDFKEHLTAENVKINLQTLTRYRDDLKEESINLIFKKCILEIRGLDEACTVIRGLEFVSVNLQNIK